MSSPERRRPGQASPISLTPQVEPVRTPATIAYESSSPTPIAASAAAEPKANREVRQNGGGQKKVAAPVVAPRSIEADVKKAVTFNLSVELKRRAETAVLRTAGFDGGYSSMSAMIEGAIERELKRLAREFNGGTEYEPNNGGFRMGRPFGS